MVGGQALSGGYGVCLSVVLVITDDEREHARPARQEEVAAHQNLRAAGPTVRLYRGETQ